MGRHDLHHGWTQDLTTPYCRENLIGGKIFVGANKDCLGDYNGNYDCDWQVIYNELMQILQNLPKRV